MDNAAGTTSKFSHKEHEHFTKTSKIYSPSDTEVQLPGLSKFFSLSSSNRRVSVASLCRYVLCCDCLPPEVNNYIPYIKKQHFISTKHFDRL